MALFEVPKRAGRAEDISIAKKANSIAKVATTSVKGGKSLSDRISTIKAMVEKNLGQYKDRYQVIRDEELLHDYITECIGNGIISIDTETDGLDPIQNHIAGPCIYTPGQKGTYIPMNHISYVTQLPVKDQLPKEIVNREFQRFLDKHVDIVMFNAKFDIRVLRNQVDLHDIYSTWDCYLAAKLLNENEPSSALKKLHQKYVLDGKTDAFTFEELFNGIPFTMIPINTGYLYAARDPEITYELYDYQRKYLREDSDREDMQNIYWVFKNIEMPCVSVVADMEDAGVKFDFDYNQSLQDKYHKILDEKKAAFYESYKPYEKEFQKYDKLENPINIESVQQLGILLYDIMGCPLYYDRKKRKETRSTAEDALQSMDNPVAKAILDYREFSTIVSTFIDKLPDCVSPDGRIHASFNQYGAKTGRFSSDNPNLQNIPSHNKEIRKMFTASPGYVLMSSDFSQQEPKCLAALCRKAGDPQMYNTFMEGKDLYSEIASKAFNKEYDQCREFNPDGSTNKEGKERRTQAKSILLGVLYGRGEKSIAEQLNCTEDKAKEIKKSVFRGFPAIKKFEEDSIYMAEDLGYVTTVCGRKRRLPDMQLLEYEFKWKDGAPPDDDLLDFGGFMNAPEFEDKEVPEDLQDKYLRKLQRAWGKDKRKIFDQAKEEGILIVDNGGKIADATRQCVNSRIQGSAADLTKLAMIKLNSNERLKQLGFRLLIQVHDEVIAECPEENMKECSELLASTMSQAAESILQMPIKCDVEITHCWYGDVVQV